MIETKIETRGRKRKYQQYNTITKPTTFAIPLELELKLKEEAERNKMNYSEYLIFLIVSANKEEALRLKNYFEETKQLIIEMKNKNTELSEKLDKLLNKTLSSIAEIYKKRIEIDEYMKKAIESRKDIVIRAITRNEGATDDILKINTDIAYRNYLAILAENNMDLKSHSFEKEIKHIFYTEFLKYIKEVRK